jgi:hypothetical protein
LPAERVTPDKRKSLACASIRGAKLTDFDNPGKGGVAPLKFKRSLRFPPVL